MTNLICLIGSDSVTMGCVFPKVGTRLNFSSCAFSRDIHSNEWKNLHAQSRILSECTTSRSVVLSFMSCPLSFSMLSCLWLSCLRFKDWLAFDMQNRLISTTPTNKFVLFWSSPLDLEAARKTETILFSSGTSLRSLRLSLSPCWGICH